MIYAVLIVLKNWSVSDLKNYRKSWKSEEINDWDTFSLKTIDRFALWCDQPYWKIDRAYMEEYKKNDEIGTICEWLEGEPSNEEVRDFFDKQVNLTLEDVAKETKIYAVDVLIGVARCYKIDASSAGEAETIVMNKIKNGNFSLFDKEWETTDELEVVCSGEEDENGVIKYY